MPYQNSMKHMLAAALKDQMEQMPLSKISVADICRQCGVNRKSFYYHFVDKYDLVNWIFDTEVQEVFANYRGAGGWQAVEALCSFFHARRGFYSKALQCYGQNSLAEHVRQILKGFIRNRTEATMDDPQQIDADFVVDGILCAMLRWMLDKNPVSAEQFVLVIRNTVERIAITVCRRMET